MLCCSLPRSEMQGCALQGPDCPLKTYRNILEDLINTVGEPPCHCSLPSHQQLTAIDSDQFGSQYALARLHSIIIHQIGPKLMCDPM